MLVHNRSKDIPEQFERYGILQDQHEGVEEIKQIHTKRNVFPFLAQLIDNYTYHLRRE